MMELDGWVDERLQVKYTGSGYAAIARFKIQLGAGGAWEFRFETRSLGPKSTADRLLLLAC